jgi:Domain of unknown function (DUF4082)/Domain of unknown function (DUF1929)/Glyoxal oxidase N-terminus
MMTRIFHRDNIRLSICGLAIALLIGVLYGPPVVQSVRPAFIDAPTNLTVLTASSGAISLSWDPAAGAVTYWLERSESMSGPFVFKKSVFNETVITDNAVAPLHAYVYRVRGLGGGGIYSAPSNMALGTAISFDFDQQIRAQHLDDLRTAINAVRWVANMPPATWARYPLNNLAILASDMQELRNRLNEALTALQIPVYPDPGLSTGTPIRATHIEELQARSTRGSSYSSGPLYSNNISRAVVGEFSEFADLPLVTVHLNVLPDRRILFWGRDLVKDGNNNIVTLPNGDAKQAAGHSEAWVWNVADKTTLQVNNPTTNLFCSGHSFLPDGRLIVTGGHQSSDFDGAGEKHINIFDYNTNSWSRDPAQDMNQGRWYPYNVTLSSGEPLVISGTYNETTNATQSQTNLVPQIFTSAGTLKNVNQPASVSNYPFLYVMPDGKVLQAQSGFGNQDSRRFDPRGNQGLGTWSSFGTMLSPHAFGTSVLYESGRKALVVGGLNNAQEPRGDAEFIDLLLAQSQLQQFPPQQPWTSLDQMRFARVYPTATVLPDGKVLVTGGVGCPGINNIESIVGGTLTCSGGQVMNPELWDPETGKWTTMAPHSEIRAYHSVAALLPDGRVLVGGGGLPGAIGEIGIYGARIANIAELSKPNARGFGHKKVEIFSPPYLFNASGNLAARPVITSAPLSVTDGETFFIGTSGTGSQPKVSLVRLPSVTHAFNQDQRQIRLDLTLASGGLYVTAPSSPNECPPGRYMLFVLNSAGVPSVAEIITVKNALLLPNDIPETTASGAGSTWEQGIEFSSAVNGQITHIRFWKALGEPNGGHIGHIWNATTGADLASAQFFNETLSGWQEAPLQTPLPITAGVRYKVTYNIHSVVAKTPNVLNYPILSWPLTGWRSFFSTPAGSFPTSESLSNLFADVRFK